MIVKLEDRKALIALASEYMNKYSINEFKALKMAENDVEKYLKNGELEKCYRIEKEN